MQTECNVLNIFGTIQEQNQGTWYIIVQEIKKTSLPVDIFFVTCSEFQKYFLWGLQLNFNSIPLNFTSIGICGNKLDSQQ